jgi:hypothetical protein
MSGIPFWRNSQFRDEPSEGASYSLPGASVPPFTAKHVTCFLAWIVLILLGVLALAWYLFEAPAHERMQPKRSGAAVHLRLPDQPAGAKAAQVG